MTSAGVGIVTPTKTAILGALLPKEQLFICHLNTYAANAHKTKLALYCSRYHVRSNDCALWALHYNRPSDLSFCQMLLGCLPSPEVCDMAVCGHRCTLNLYLPGGMVYFCITRQALVINLQWTCTDLHKH